MSIKKLPEQEHSTEIKYEPGYQSKSKLDDQYNVIRKLVLKLAALVEIQIVAVDNSRTTAWLITYQEQLQEILVATEEFYRIFLKELDNKK